MGPIRDLEDSSTMDIETVELNQVRLTIPWLTTFGQELWP